MKTHRFLLGLYMLGASLPASAQFYDRDGKSSPVQLLAAPPDGAAYYRMKERVRALIGEDILGYWSSETKATPDQAREAEPLAEQLVRDYPRDGENWLLLATAKKLLNKPAEAAAAYEREGEIDGWDPYTGWNAAASHVAAGNKPAAMALIRAQIFDRRTVDRAAYFDDKAFEPLRSDPEFVRLTGREDAAGQQRDRGWATDLDFLVAEVKRINPDYRDGPLPAEFMRRYEALRKDIPQQSDEQIFVGMNHMLASLNQGHTQLFGLKDTVTRIPDRKLPVRFHLFPEGLYIINATPEYRDLIGARVEAIGNTAALDAVRRAAALQSVDGDMEYVWSSMTILGSAPFLKGMGIVPSNDAVALTVRIGSGAPTKRVLTTVANLNWANFSPPSHLVVPLNVYKDTPFQQERAVPEHDALYVQFNQVLDDRDETLTAFGRRLDAVIAASKPHNLIVDMRANAGGSTALAAEMVRSLIAFSRPPGNRLFVIIGRRTYSAAGNTVTDLERFANPVFVGEATSECCRLNGDPSHVVLPFSKIEGVLTGTKWNLSTPWDTRREISPEVPVQLSAGDYFAGKDPALETIYRLIEEDRGNKTAR